MELSFCISRKIVFQVFIIIFSWSATHSFTQLPTCWHSWNFCTWFTWKLRISQNCTWTIRWVVFLIFFFFFPFFFRADLFVRATLVQLIPEIYARCIELGHPELDFYLFDRMLEITLRFLKNEENMVSATQIQWCRTMEKHERDLFIFQFAFVCDCLKLGSRIGHQYGQDAFAQKLFGIDTYRGNGLPDQRGFAEFGRFAGRCSKGTKSRCICGENSFFFFHSLHSLHYYSFT